jgi:hypothetical protein
MVEPERGAGGFNRSRLVRRLGRRRLNANHFRFWCDTLGDVPCWPTEWFTLHGIVEVRLPVLKFCRDGNAAATAYRIRFTGGESPEHAAQGLEFPNRAHELVPNPAPSCHRHFLSNTRTLVRVDEVWYHPSPW